MSLGKKPTVFVSSTCYDLKQIRTNIKSFFEDELGYDVLLSEYNFPLDPNVSPVENCIRAVDERADIFVLIVGCRYGSVTDTGHSVTNLEYLRARAKRIPVYAFVDKRIITTLPFWRDNQNGNFSSTVDSTKIFEFVSDFRNIDNVWTYEFENAKDIINTLKDQLSHLFNDCLMLRQKATPELLTAKIRKLDGRAFQIALLQPDAWEYKLFSQVLHDGLAILVDRRRDFNLGISFAPIYRANSLEETTDFISSKCEQLLRAIDILSILFNKAYPEAIGKPGEPGNADYILYTANKIVEVYSSIIDWSLDCVSVLAEDSYVNIINYFSKMCDATLCDIENFSKKYSDAIKDIPTHIPADWEPTEIDISLNLTIPELKDFYVELNKIRTINGLEPVNY